MHRFPVTVYYEDTDLGGIVYHANYLKFIERARSDWVRSLGLDQNALRAQGLIFAVHRIEADFLAPARLDDRLTVTTRPLARSPARLTLDQQVHRGETGLFRAKVTLVSITTLGKPRRLPAELQDLGGNA
ncbi:MAG: tol-pal system-associated acyl-CoA thioesterase [Rhodobacteraceae bacterium]|nr:tol-pal system-associated acyl-CoA thioesterase [Paracoccaceae bacterium]